MAISPPNWAPNAVPTPRGWAHPVTGEILKSQKLSNAQIKEFYGAPASMPVQLNEALPNDKPVDQWTHEETEAGEKQGVFSRLNPFGN